MVVWEYGQAKLKYNADWPSDYWLTACLSLPRKCGFKSIHISLIGLVGWLFGCHDILILGKGPIKWKQCPDMTKAVDWDV